MLDTGPMGGLYRHHLGVVGSLGAFTCLIGCPRARDWGLVKEVQGQQQDGHRGSNEDQGTFYSGLKCNARVSGAEQEPTAPAGFRLWGPTAHGAELMEVAFSPL